jgi:alpha-L-fucosidase
MIRRWLFWAGLSVLICSGSGAQAPVKYEPTIASLDKHPLPGWYAGAKFGIFVCWGPYSVPGWAPLSHPDHDFDSTDFIRNNPYAEWYSNVMQIDGSATQAYHRQHYGAKFNYYDFVPVFDRESAKWNPDSWAEIFQDTGARYVVFTAKFHDGFSMWPSKAPNPTLPPDRVHATRDIVGELTSAVRAHGMRMGVYYSGGFDWTFKFGPIEKNADYETTKPKSQAYGDYVFTQIHELIDWYHPALLWNDIDWPKSGRPLQVEADYYNTVPDGVVDDRFGVKHTDFITQEYRKLDAIEPKKWEENRGLGRSFGYNRAEGEAETIAPGELIALLVDIVSKNGNLLLDVGPEADGTVPAVQMERLKALGAWLRQNGEAIYDTTPWTQAVGKSAEGDDLRFTRKGTDLFVTVLGTPKAQTITMPDVPAKLGVPITQLGEPTMELGAKVPPNGMRIVLRMPLKGDYAYSFKLAGYLR